MNNWAASAEVSAGKLRTELDDKAVAAEGALQVAEARLRNDEHIRVDLPIPPCRPPAGWPNCRAAVGHWW